MYTAVKLITGLLILGALTGSQGVGHEREPLVDATGFIRGTVFDAQTLAPLPNANIAIEGTNDCTVADEDGSFDIRGLSFGSYVVRISHVGYKTLYLHDVEVRSAHDCFIEAALEPVPVEREGIVVRARADRSPDAGQGSSVEFSAADIRRSPGAEGGVARLLMVLPSVAKVDDTKNNLMVRGGSPIENGFYIDNIEIPNINHFPLHGTTAAPIELVNPEFIQSVRFSAGGFSAAYGDRLSSIMELEFRDGNRSSTDWQLDLHIAGLGFAGEGPVCGRRGAWMLGVRRSYFDVIAGSLGGGVVPRMNDYQGKMTYDLSPRNKLTLIGLLGYDSIKSEKNESEESGLRIYGDHEGREYAAGVNWRCLWKENGCSNTSLAYLGTRVMGERRRTKTGVLYLDEDYTEETIQLRNVNRYEIGESQGIQFGIEGKLYLYDYDSWYGSMRDDAGNFVPAQGIDEHISAPQGAAFLSYTVNPIPRLSVTLGLRYDYFEYNGASHLSPRSHFTCRVSERLSFHGASGIYHQHLPLGLLTCRDSYQNLKDPLAYHYILGVSYLLADSTRGSIEGYHKSYRNFPQDPEQPAVFVADQDLFQYFLQSRRGFLDDGRARSYGVEFTVHRNLVSGIYGLVTATYFVSEYRDMEGNWRDRIHDNRVIFSTEGGFRPNERWEFGIRWIYAGGPPFTPLDLLMSRRRGGKVIDMNRVNEERYPDYHSLNFRLERVFRFSGSNLTLYLSVWNIYNRSNVAYYYWNSRERKQDVRYQFGLIPLIGVIYDF